MKRNDKTQRKLIQLNSTMAYTWHNGVTANDVCIYFREEKENEEEEKKVEQNQGKSMQRAYCMQSAHISIPIAMLPKPKPKLKPMLWTFTFQFSHYSLARNWYVCFVEWAIRTENEEF